MVITRMQWDSVMFVVQYKLHASADAMAPSIPEDDSSLGACCDDSVDIDMEKLKAEAKEVALMSIVITIIHLRPDNMQYM